ncbi:hypothetical protein JMJ55_29080 [Belnapia sp. T6]|uniref:Uncharacterized protein n=1 Tax=Belnapia mucosa TaxID=2804532 RepID=A0ABS1VCH8_9PROT|nr:hypothetical protein [Belnapia mucosa]MBL6459374.1 hypothetical protein [Belnapia mucosa]
MVAKLAAWEPQFRTEGTPWLKMVLDTDEAKRRLSGYACAADHLLGEILRYGALSDAGMIRDLQGLYRTFVEGGMSVALRREIYRHVAGFQQQSDFLSANAYLPFITCEPERSICSTAVIDFVSTVASPSDDPLSAVRDIVKMIAARFPCNPGAAFGGLLYLGDPRVCRLLWPLKDELDDDEANEASLCFTGILSAATIEFQLGWLEGMEGDGQDRRFGVVASGLALQRRIMKVPFVMTGQRPFPVASVSPEEQMRMQRPVPIDEYTVSIAPRLLALERTEPEPKVMPEVLAIWGLAPPLAAPIRHQF